VGVCVGFDPDEPFYQVASELYWAFFETRAANSSNLESKSFKMGDLFDLN
jgi:hypothetical protein